MTSEIYLFSEFEEQDKQAQATRLQEATERVDPQITQLREQLAGYQQRLDELLQLREVFPVIKQEPIPISVEKVDLDIAPRDQLNYELFERLGSLAEGLDIEVSLSARNAYSTMLTQAKTAIDNARRTDEDLARERYLQILTDKGVNEFAETQVARIEDETNTYENAIQASFEGLIASVEAQIKTLEAELNEAKGLPTGTEEDEATESNEAKGTPSQTQRSEAMESIEELNRAVFLKKLIRIIAEDRVFVKKSFLPGTQEGENIQASENAPLDYQKLVDFMARYFAERALKEIEDKAKIGMDYVNNFGFIDSLADIYSLGGEELLNLIENMNSNPQFKRVFAAEIIKARILLGDIFANRPEYEIGTNWKDFDRLATISFKRNHPVTGERGYYTQDESSGLEDLTLIEGARLFLNSTGLQEKITSRPSDTEFVTVDINTGIQYYVDLLQSKTASQKGCVYQARQVLSDLTQRSGRNIIPIITLAEARADYRSRLTAIPAGEEVDPAAYFRTTSLPIAQARIRELELTQQRLIDNRDKSEATLTEQLRDSEIALKRIETDLGEQITGLEASLQESIQIRKDQETAIGHANHRVLSLEDELTLKTDYLRRIKEGLGNIQLSRRGFLGKRQLSSEASDAITEAIELARQANDNSDS